MTCWRPAVTAMVLVAEGDTALVKGGFPQSSHNEAPSTEMEVPLITPGAGIPRNADPH